MTTRLPTCLVLLFYGCVFLFCFHGADADLWGRMAAGRLAAASGHVPRQDVFAYVETKAVWVDHEWLSGRIFFEVYDRFSGPGLVALRLFLGLAAVGLAAAAAKRRIEEGWARALALGASLPLIAQGYISLVRAQAFTFALFALFLFILERARQGRTTALVLLPVATAFWANVHGGFVVGVMLIVMYATISWIGGRKRDGALLLLVAVVCFLATAINPYGLSYWSYLKDALLMPRPYIVEWRPVQVSSWDDLHIGLALVLTLVVALRARSLPPEAILALSASSAASFLAVRFAPFLGLAMIVFLPEPFARIFSRAAQARERRLREGTPPLVVMLLSQYLFVLGALLAWQERSSSFDLRVRPDHYPVKALSFITERGYRGNLAVFFDWGEYALYHLYPTCRVSFDGRLETVYPNDVIRLNLDFMYGKEEGRRLLTDYGTELALYPPDVGAPALLDKDPVWERVYRDETALVYRKLTRSAAFAAAGFGESQSSVKND